MERLKLAIIGCGGMGRRHLNGLFELERAGLNPFALAAVVDVDRERAEALAALAQERLGHRPRVVGGEPLAGSPLELDAVDVCADPRSHHTIVAEALQCGWHVMVEKPLALTVRACRAIARALAAAGPGRVLSVAENYRRDPINRLAKALLEAGAVGEPRLLIQQSVGGGDRIIITPWRHLKNTSGILLDMGVHYADLMEHLLGPVERVTAHARCHEPVRRGAGGVEVRATAEDACYALLRFRSGAAGQFIEDHAGRGRGLWQRLVYGGRGSLSLPGDRSGRPPELALEGREPVSDGRLLDLVPDFHLDEATATLFGGDRLWRYDLEFPAIDGRLLALEYAEFGRCIADGSTPEVTAEVGTRAVALCYALLESSVLGRTVTVEEVVDQRVDAYQREIDEELGLV